MFAQPSTEILAELSKTVQAAGRSIKSPKRDLDDLETLAQTLELAAAALRSVKNYELLLLK